MTSYYFGGQEIQTPVVVETDELLFANDTISMKQDRIKGTSQRWRVSFSLIPHDDPTDDGVAFGLRLLAQTTPQTMPFPQFHPGLPSVLNFTTKGNVVAGISSITLAGDASSLKAGRMVKFSNHSKVYMVLTTAPSGSDTTVTFYPSLQSNVPNSSLMSAGSGVTFRYLIDLDMRPGITIEDGVIVNQGTISLVEAL